jgi:predicted XRE-type DNA-binding protein
VVKTASAAKIAKAIANAVKTANVEKKQAAKAMANAQKAKAAKVKVNAAENAKIQIVLAKANAKIRIQTAPNRLSPR